MPDPLQPSGFIDDVAARVAPRHRVISVSPRGDAPYQVDAVDLVGVLTLFGFDEPTLMGERLGCVTALVLAAWYPARVGSLILVEPAYVGPPGGSPVARALSDASPDWAQLRARVRCAIHEVARPEEVEALLP